VKPWVIGQDPANIEEIWQLIYRRHLRIGGRGPISAVISGIDIALWDIKGKALGVPVYQLLGGPVRDHVPLYTHVHDARQAATKRGYGPPDQSGRISSNKDRPIPINGYPVRPFSRSIAR